MSPRAALKELVELLDDYAPMWYTEAQRSRATVALIKSVEQQSLQAPQQSAANPMRLSDVNGPTKAAG